jgi:hypothetical protein
MLNWLANFSIDHKQKKSIQGENEVKKPSVAENDEWRIKRNSILQIPDIPKTQSILLDRIISPIVFIFNLVDISKIKKRR